ncbi:hypothetical protein SISNIDRAFT_450254 [Sistotremastrum niveocremeum HHB9708]|uniref:Protein kinase domain-containing protein n=1 Tax=Sistotremastrum niveocremeum HHB9708 TaxID=1314777 RepID=A0A164Z1K9_9AGAM|nr:hypothetical protein SISNIDRAFT_450254 [Sistotremastrum niveocremeum HHB9708]
MEHPRPFKIYILDVFYPEKTEETGIPGLTSQYRLQAYWCKDGQWMGDINFTFEFLTTAVDRVHRADLHRVLQTKFLRCETFKLAISLCDVRDQEKQWGWEWEADVDAMFRCCKFTFPITLYPLDFASESSKAPRPPVYLRMQFEWEDDRDRDLLGLHEPALDLDGDRTQQYSLDRRFRAWDKGDGTCRQGFLFLDERDYMHQPSKVKGAHVVRITPKIVNYTFADVWHRVDFEEQRFELLKKIRVARRVRHKHVLRHMGFCMDGAGLSILILQVHKRAPDMESYLKTFPGPSIKKKLVVGLASGLAYLHLYGFRPMVLRAENVFIRGDDQAMLCDGGPVNYIREMSGNVAIQDVDLRWISPELRHIGHIGIVGSPPPTLYHDGDVWSFACLIARTFSNRKPYNEMSDQEMQVLRSPRRDPKRKPYDTDFEGQSCPAWVQAFPRLVRMCEACWSLEQWTRPKSAWIADNIAAAIPLF